MRKILISIFLLATISSCYKDKNDYNYSNIALLDVDSIINSVAFPNGDIGVEYTYTLDLPEAVTNSYDIMWEQGNTLDSAIVYSYGEKLTFTPQTTSAHYFQLVATNKSTGGVSVSEHFPIYINSISTSMSWLVLGEYEGQTGISVIYPESERVSDPVNGGTVYVRLDPTIHYNVNTDIATYNPKRLMFAVESTRYYNVSGGTTTINEHSLLVKCDGDAVFLNGTYPHPTAASMKDGGIIDMPADFELAGYFHNNQECMMFDTKGRYYKKRKAVGAVYNYETPYYQVPLIYEGEEVKVLAMMNDQFCEQVNSGSYLLGLVVEKPDGKRMVIYVDHDEYYEPRIYSGPMTYIGEGEDVLNFLDLKDWNLMWSYNNGYRYNYSFWRNSAGEAKISYVYRTSSGSTNNYSSITTKSFPRADIIDETTLFEWQEINYVYIAHGNKLYKYYFTTNACEEYYEMPVGETITAINMNAQEREILIGTDKGTIHAVDITNTTIAYEDRFLREIGGFSRIDDIEYKFNTYFQLIFCGYNSSTSTTYWD